MILLAGSLGQERLEAAASRPVVREGHLASMETGRAAICSKNLAAILSRHVNDLSGRSNFDACPHSNGPARRQQGVIIGTLQRNRRLIGDRGQPDRQIACESSLPFRRRLKLVPASFASRSRARAMSSRATRWNARIPSQGSPLRTMVRVLMQVTRQSSRAVNQRCSLSGNRFHFSDGQGQIIPVIRMSREVTKPGHPLADAMARAGGQVGRGVHRQLTAVGRNDTGVHGPADAADPVVDEQRDLFGQVLLEAEADQIAAGEPEQIGRTDAHGQQTASQPTAHAADREDRAPVVHAAKVMPPSRVPVQTGRRVEDVDLSAPHPPYRLRIIERQGLVGGCRLGTTEREKFLHQITGRPTRPRNAPWQDGI